MLEEIQICLVGKVPECGCVAVHCEEYKRVPISILEVLVNNWVTMGLVPDLVDHATCEATYRKCSHKNQWYHDMSLLPPETRDHANAIIKALQVMRALAEA